MKQTSEFRCTQPRLRLNIDGRPINSELLPPQAKKVGQEEKAERDKQD